MTPRSLAVLLAALLLAACSKSSETNWPAPSPALWEIADENGARGYLFGTIHALPDGVEWRTPAFEKAFANSDTLVLEIAALDDKAGMERVFAELAHTPRQPPLPLRVSPPKRPELMRMLRRARMQPGDFAAIETWAAALVLTRAVLESDSRNGVDRALLDMAGDRTVRELEGAEKQLRIFDALPESEQRDLLESVVSDEGSAQGRRMIATAWIAGDLEAIEQQSRGGLLADPELREALLAGRNRDWAERTDALLRSDAVPFIAAGAAHMAGDGGLPALLEDRGWRIRRIQ